MTRCADFCDLPRPTAAAPDDVHGPWWVSPAIGREVIAEADRGPIEISVDRVRAWDAGHEPSLIRLVLGPLPATTAPATPRLTSGSARQLAATLIHAADLADELHRPHARSFME